MRVFLDANILFSAAKSDGAMRTMLRLLVDHGHDCRADAYVVAEARRNLAAKGPQALDDLDALLTQVQIAAVAPTTEPGAELDWLSKEDRPVVAAAIRLGCYLLVTGDRTYFRLGYGRTIGGVTIHSPRSLAEHLLA